MPFSGYFRVLHASRGSKIDYGIRNKKCDEHSRNFDVLYVQKEPETVNCELCPSYKNTLDKQSCFWEGILNSSDQIAPT